MARPREKLDENARDAVRVGEALRERGRTATDIRRLTAVQLGFEAENSLESIAETVGTSVSSLLRWFAAYRKGGVEKLLECGRSSGRKPKITPEQSAALKAAVSENKFRRAADARDWMRKNLGVEAPMPSVYRYLGKSKRG